MHILIYILIFLLVLGLLLAIWGCIEARMLNIQKDSIVLSGDKNVSLRVLYFSDLHAEFCFIPANRVIDILKKEHTQSPIDIVIFGGDICNKISGYQKGANYLNKIALACQELGIPFVGTNGNHDVTLSSREIDSCGFKNISGANYMLNKDNQIIRFSGVADSGRKNRQWMDTPSCNDEYDMHIMLSHNPDQYLYLKGDKPEVMLCGHVHGGQIRTPIGIEFSLLRKDELPRKGIISGLHNKNGLMLYISKGIGCVFLPFRIGSRPEINIISISKNQK